MHLGGCFSLRETAVPTRQAELADLSDVALLKRLRKGKDWLYACACFVSLFVPSPASRLASCHGLLWTNPTPSLASGRYSCR